MAASAEGCLRGEGCLKDLDDRERLERRVYLNLLYDFYSPLLTERQRSVYEMLYFSDLAESEAARSLGVTRQAVHILERRVMERLEKIEGELRFAETTRRLEQRIQELERENGALRQKLGEAGDG